MISRALAVAVAALFLGLPPPCGAGGQVRIKLATLAPTGSSVHGQLLEMRDDWRRAPEGGVDLVVFADGTMGGEHDMVRRLRTGQLQAAALTSVGLSMIEPSAGAVQFMPMVFRSWEEVDYVRERIQEDLQARIRAKGFTVLFWADAGWVRYFSREPYRVPSDLKKQRIFVWAGDSAQVALMDRMGFRPVPLETGDILPGLKTGLVDVVPTTAVFANASQIYRSAPYVASVRWAPILGACVVSLRVWDGLSPAVREALNLAAVETGERIRAQTREEDERALEAMQGQGLHVERVTPQEAAEWSEIAEQAHPGLRGTMVPEEIFDRVLGLVSKFRNRGRQ